MRKRIGLAIITIFTIMITLCSCHKTEKKHIVEVDIKGGYTAQVAIGEFNPENYYITRTYSDGSTDEVKVEKSMISDYDILQTYEPGNKQINVSYMGAKLTLDIEVTRKKFDLSMESQTFVYDGNSHSLTVKGYVPLGTKIYSVTGDKFVNVGEYDVSLTYTCNNYENLTLTGKLTIVKADLNVEKLVSFADQQLDYDGENHKIEVSGELPKDVSVNYFIGEEKTNIVTEAGEYNVVAKFSCANADNYNDIPDMLCKVTVKKAVYDVEEISLGTAYRNYTGEEIEWRITNSLPKWIEVTYENNIQQQVGDYTISVKLTITNNNYCFVNGMSSIVLTRDVSIIPE